MQNMNSSQIFNKFVPPSEGNNWLIKLTSSLRLSSMALALGDCGSVLTERALSRAFICRQSESRVSRSETRCGFFPILFNLRENIFHHFIAGETSHRIHSALFSPCVFIFYPFFLFDFSLTSRICHIRMK